MQTSTRRAQKIWPIREAAIQSFFARSSGNSYDVSDSLNGRRTRARPTDLRLTCSYRSNGPPNRDAVTRAAGCS